MISHAPWIAWVVLGGVTIAACYDLATRRIPNWLIVAVFAAALIYHGGHGAMDLLRSMGAAALVLIPGTYAHARRWLGGGDVKLAAAVAAVFSLPDMAGFLLYAAVSGGVLALGALAIASRRDLGSRLNNLAANFFTGTLQPVAGRSTPIPYGVAIACGAALAQCAYAFPFMRLTL
jgi:prepilin peptidase CpaA